MEDKIKNSRLTFEKLGSNYRKAENVKCEKEVIGEVDCYWLCTDKPRGPNKLIIYLHGGCFALGSINSHHALVSHLVAELDIPILLIDYSLAPENPFPAAINEIVKVYKHILYQKQLKDICFMGDSAGAGLAVSVISILNKDNIVIPVRLVLLSPWVDLSATNNSITENAGIDPILAREQLQSFTSLYVGSVDLSAANPIEAMFGDFPPTLIIVGSNEILLDDSKILYAKISKTQNDIDLKIYEGQTHVWLLDDIDAKASKDAIQKIKDFIRLS